MRVVVVDDAVLLRAGLVRLLGEAGHTVVAELGDTATLGESIASTAAELVLLDVRLPPTFTTEGLVAARELRRTDPGLAILVLSQYVEAAEAVDLVAGSSEGLGYLLKDRVADVRDFLDAIEEVGRGGTVIDPEVIRQLLATRRRADPLEALTPRELDVLDLMAQGLSNAAIADRLVVSEGAVEKHIGNLLAKLGLGAHEGTHRRVQAVLTYLDHRGSPATGPPS
ncbi:MAG: response regulator transcription factor [Acidimicrobiales bacterium]|jgi:DNA-binding NarL/FixJ family response regulator|nr:response regulator transcription factor [Acidimicrobiales bacterium]